MHTQLSNLRRSALARGAALLAASLVWLAPSPARASVVVVDPTHLNGWSIQNFDDNTSSNTTSPTTSGTNATFAVPPATPPLGTGSLRQHVGTDGNDGTRMKTDAFDGMLLSAITSLSYSTYITNYIDGQASYMVLAIDLDNNGTADDFMFFEPVYQTGTYSGDAVQAQNGGNVNLNMWQIWDAKVGGWWLDSDNYGGPPLHTLANYITAHPGARLAFDTAGLRVNAGFGAGAWDNYNGFLDNVTVNSTTYDFENGDKVSANTSGLCISGVHPCVNVPVNFDRSDATPARGLSVTFQLSANLQLCSTPAASIHQGSWLNAYSTTYQVIDNGGGSYTVDQAILGLPCGITTGGQAFTIDVKRV